MKFRISILTLFITCISFAQEVHTLLVIENGGGKILSKIDHKSSFASSHERDAEVNKILITLWNDAYLAARVDSASADSIHQTVYIDPGNKFQWAQLKKGNVDEGILSDVGFHEKAYHARKIKYASAAKVEEDIVKWCEDHGYPFASVKLDSVEIRNDGISASLDLTKNRFTKIDSIELKGDLKLSRAYLYSYIGIAPGDPYSETKLQDLEKRLKELPFASSTQPYTVLFSEKYTKLTLYLNKKPAGQFDGIVGFLPDSRTGKILFTGDARLKLQNSFGHGEVIDINWRRLQEQTQDLKANFTYPYLFRTPFGIDYRIKLYKRDTTYIDVNQQFGIIYFFSATSSITAYVKRKNSSLLSTYGLEAATVLPQYADIDATTYGLKFNREVLDYRFNPRRGYSFTASAEAGIRTIRKNAKLNPAIYENIALKSSQYGGELEAAKYWPIGKKSTIKTGVQSATLYNSGGIFTNELFRIGGLKSLRGFDEESIYASSYAIGTIEYRFLLEQNSALFLFTDAGWYEKNTRDSFVTDSPYGFGGGLFFETKAGIFSMSYGLGNQFNQGIKFKDGKIHVGFVGLF